jgi:hypothetical protein
MMTKHAAWIGCGAVLTAGALWFGFRDKGAASGRPTEPAAGTAQQIPGKQRETSTAPSSGRDARATGPGARVEAIPEAERLVIEGKATPAQVAAVAKATALVPQFKQVLQLAPEQAETQACRLMDEMADLPVLTEPLVNSMRDVLLSGSPGMIDYATGALETQSTPESAGLLADLLHHPNEDVRDSALTALEGMAGDVFDTPEAAENWARNWRLTPQEQAELLEQVTLPVGARLPAVPDLPEEP